MLHKVHKLTVGERWIRGNGWNDPGENGYNQPLIRIGGKWLVKYGFDKNTKVKIYATQNRLMLEVENTPKTNWVDIPGQEHAKRAIEIAMVGGHSIKFIGNSEATNLNNYATQNNIASIVFKPCPCGYLGHPQKACVCLPSQIRRWQKAICNHKADLTIDVPPTKPEHYTDRRPLEAEKQVLKRVERAKRLLTKVEPVITDESGKSLMRQAITMMGLELEDIKRVEAVTRTIASLSSESKIQPVHLAEALQYRPRDN